MERQPFYWFISKTKTRPGKAASGKRSVRSILRLRLERRPIDGAVSVSVSSFPPESEAEIGHFLLPPLLLLLLPANNEGRKCINNKKKKKEKEEEEEKEEEIMMVIMRMRNESACMRVRWP